MRDALMDSFLYSRGNQEGMSNFSEEKNNKKDSSIL